MTPPTTTPNARDKKKPNSAPSSPNVDVSVPSRHQNLRSSSMGGKTPQQQLQQHDTKPAPMRPIKTLLSKCPCQASNEKSWRIKCSCCRQVWHTSCCHLVAKTLTEKVVIELEKEWICPWCFVPPFLRPANHPSIQNESKLFGAVVAGVISDKITESVEDCIAAKITEMGQSIDTCVTQAVDAQMVKIGEEMDKIQERILSNSTTIQTSTSLSPQGNDSDNSCTIPNPTNHIEDYIEVFLNAEEASDALKSLSELQFSKVKGREVSSFGERYTYTGAPSSNNKDIPPFLKKLIEKLEATEGYQNMDINQVIVNKYTGSHSYLPEHSDNEPSLRPQSRILTLSIGSERNMLFRDKWAGREERLAVPNGSLYAMAQESQHYWTHRIDKEETGGDARYSITLRSVGSQYKNATIILGDSNTKHLKFGSGKQKEKGTFGFHLPGQRVESFHIRDIDPKKCIGYQNVLLHCGINDIRDKSPGRLSNDANPLDIDAHFAMLVEKIKEIKLLCPYTSILVSPILPTKNYKLNKRVVQFNSLLFDFVTTNDNSDGVRCLDFSEFVDSSSGTLREDLGTWDSENGCLNKKDILHLGKSGIRLLAKIVKQSVQHRYVTNRSYRDTLSLSLGVS